MRDIPLVLVGPRRLFARVEDVRAWGWPLVILLTSVTLTGWATVQTGLIDRQNALTVATRLAVLESTQRDVVERSALRDLYEQEYKKGAFELLLVRIQTIAAAPVEALATVLLVAAVLYGVVALSGRKPEWHTLLTICVFAGMIDALQRWVQLALMLHFQTLEVDTSAAALVAHWATANGVKPATAAVWSALAGALDPFRVWFWWVIVAGVITTAQLRRWRAWSVCTFCWLIAAGARGALAFAAARAPLVGGEPPM